MSLPECTLCGLPVGKSGLREKQGKKDLHFCCLGCRQVFKILSGLPGGLPDDFRNSSLYRLSQASGLIGVDDLGKSGEKIQNQGPMASEGSEAEDPLARGLILKVEGMWCSACAWLIEGVLGRFPGVIKVEALFFSDLVRIRYLPHQVTLEDIQERLSQLGYRSSTLQDTSLSARERKNDQLRLGISAILTFHVMMISLALYAGFFQDLGSEAIGYLSYPLSILATPVLFYGGYPIFKKALIGLGHGNPNMEVLIALGALSAYTYSLFRMGQGSLHLYFDTAAMLIVLVLLGKYLESRAKERISRGLTELVLLANQKVRFLSEGGEKWLAAEEVRPGDEFEVWSGERVAVDGRILSGRAGLDQSSLTGESRPIQKGPDDEVQAGSLLLSGPLRIRATRVGTDSAIGRLITMIQEGLSRKTTFELFADRLTRWVIPGLLGLAVGTALYLFFHGYSLEVSLLRAITILVITCPCTLGIAIPLAKVAAIGVGRTKGFLFRNPAALEKIEGLDVLIFDKTGTLTEGRYVLRKIITLEGSGPEALRRIASLESLSDHFLARAIQDKARESSLDLEAVKDFQMLPGLGIKGLVAGHPVIAGNRNLMQAQGMEIPETLGSQANRDEVEGMTVVFFGWKGQVRGFITFGDQLKESARETLSYLRQRGYQLWILSGDSKETSAAVAGRLGISSFLGQALPQDKVDLIRELQKQGHRVGMIGDGFNDAAALAQADVGFALGTKAEISARASDVTLLTDDPMKIREVIDLSIRTMRIIRQNLGFAFLYNVLGIPLAMSGLLNPMIAVLAMFASSLTVIGNTMRLSKTASKN
ncbi:MAG: cation-translocating P-type ATPase [Deltaproteobacteria bacterium]|nr:cation-translocating P-type ATPase [Deltaproteobacteria bacterium]